MGSTIDKFNDLKDNEYKGDLKGVPKQIVDKMLYYQVKQGNKKDVSVFEKSIDSGVDDGGFSWDNTEERFMFWDCVLISKTYHLFFKKYPTESVFHTALKLLMEKQNNLKKELEEINITIKQLEKITF